LHHEGGATDNFNIWFARFEQWANVVDRLFQYVYFENRRNSYESDDWLIGDSSWHLNIKNRAV